MGRPGRLSVVNARVALVKQVTARTAHEIPDQPPLQLTVGKKVRAGDYDTEWPEFVFVTTAHGTGWVPARHLSQPSGPAVAQTAYDTTELPTRIGDVLDVLAEDRSAGGCGADPAVASKAGFPLGPSRTRPEAPSASRMGSSTGRYRATGSATIAV